MSVQAQIRFLVDFHAHNGTTDQLANLDPVEREQFLEACARELVGNRLPDYIALGQTSDFRPVLAFETGTRSPSLEDIDGALRNAIVQYNEAGFPLRFDPDVTSEHALVPLYACIQWVWENGVLVKKYNYDLRVIGGTPPTAPSDPSLVAGYRIQLTYT